jgi:hypothetical protein
VPAGAVGPLYTSFLVVIMKRKNNPSKQRPGPTGFQVRGSQRAASSTPVPLYPPDEPHWVASDNYDRGDPFAGTLDGCLSIVMDGAEDTVSYRTFRERAIRTGSIEVDDYEIAYQPRQAATWIELKGSQV